MDIKKHFKKTWVIIAMIVSFGIIVAVAVQIPSFLRMRRLDKMVRDMKHAEEDWYAAQMADTYGGTTPQDTLRMFIEAMEQENYELASKYFVIEEQEDILGVLTGSTASTTVEMIQFLKEDLSLMDSKGLEIAGGFSAAKDRYVILDPIVVELYLYPNSLWKIVKI